MVHLALEQYEEAQRSFRRALEVNPNMVGVELELLKLEERLKDKRKHST
jgi:tetratricopeptide (TPR) repeat protein